MASRSKQMHDDLAIRATVIALSLGAVAAAILAYEYYSSSDTTTTRARAAERAAARYRAAWYRRHLSRVRIHITRQRRRKEIPAAGPEILAILVDEIFPKKKTSNDNKNHQRQQSAGNAGFCGTSDRPQPSAAGLLRIDRIEQNPDREYVVWLVRSSSPNTSRGGEQICVPLLPFCQVVLDSSQHVYTHTLCFVYDATGGQDNIVLNLLRADPSVMTSSHGRPALWMKQWSTDLRLSKDHQDLVLQALVRVEAALLQVANQKIAAKTATKQKTIVFPISTEYVPFLMAALHSVFPNDKHIFLYTGCVQAAALSKHRPVIIPLKPLVSIHVPGTTEFHAALAKLPSPIAAAVEAWMAAVDALLLRQDDFVLTSSDRFFRPYVCRLDHLLLDAGQYNGDDDVAVMVQNNGAVRSLLQYCCGAVATADPHIVEAAAKMIQSTTRGVLVSPTVSKYTQEIDAVVFCHERIVMSDRILPNTLPPAEQWTCACCIGSTDDTTAVKEKHLLSMKKKGGSINVSVAHSSRAAQPNFADGRMGFAFDPSRFA